VAKFSVYHNILRVNLYILEVGSSLKPKLGIYVFLYHTLYYTSSVVNHGRERERERGERSISEASVPLCFSDFDACWSSKKKKKRKRKKYREKCAGKVIILSIFNFAAFGFLSRVSAYKPHPLSFAGVRTRWVFHLLVILSGFLAFTTDPFDASLDFADLKIGFELKPGWFIA
jgi:hypothetical protein